MQLFPLGAGTTAGKPAQLLCILVTAADYCFVYNSSTASPGAGPGPRCSVWYPWDGYTGEEGCGSTAARRAREVLCSAGVCSSAQGVHGEAGFPPPTPLRGDLHVT